MNYSLNLTQQAQYFFSLLCETKDGSEGVLFIYNILIWESMRRYMLMKERFLAAQIFFLHQVQKSLLG